MSIRIDLLPDIRQQRIKEARRRQSVTVIAVLVWIVAGGITLLLGLYNGTQKFEISRLSGKIADKKDQLSQTPGLVDAMTAQKALTDLPGLNSQKVYYTKFFAAYSQIAPSDVALSSLFVDSTNTLKVSGVAASYTTVAKLANALAAENVTVGPNANSSNQPYFTGVDISQVSKSSTGQVSFSLSATVGGEVTSGSN